MTNKSEIRKDYVQEKYVIIAPRRAKRPHTIDKNKIGNIDDCSFCPSKVDKVDDLLTIGPKNNWRVKVIKNIFPAVLLNNPKSYGQQEVIIETPNHQQKFHELSVDHIVDILDAYSLRTIEVTKNKKIEYILIFKNSGKVAGASIGHPHSQLFATEFLPPHLFDKSQKVQEYKLKNGTCVYCDVIKKESRGPRFIWKDENIIAFCPYASMYNYEVWIMPFRHLDNITILNNQEKKSLAKILKHIVTRINTLDLSYNYYFHSVVNDEDQHLYMKIKPRGSVWAGLEIGSGLVINPIAPEAAAKFYRQGLK